MICYESAVKNVVDVVIFFFTIPLFLVVVSYSMLFFKKKKKLFWLIKNLYVNNCENIVAICCDNILFF